MRQSFKGYLKIPIFVVLHHHVLHNGLVCFLPVGGYSGSHEKFLVCPSYSVCLIFFDNVDANELNVDERVEAIVRYSDV